MNDITLTDIDHHLIESTNDISKLKYILTLLINDNYYTELIQKCKQKVDKLSNVCEGEPGNFNANNMIASFISDITKIDKSLNKLDSSKILPPIRNTTASLSSKKISESPSDIEANLIAAREKDKGNEAFKSNDYKEALIYYSSSLTYDSKSKSAAIVYSNRGLVYQKTKQYEKAELDYTKALECDSKYVKALSRRATTLLSRGKYLLSIKDCLSGLELVPDDKELTRQLKEAEKMYAESEGKNSIIELRKVFKNPNYVCPWIKDDKPVSQTKVEAKPVKKTRVAIEEDEDEKDEKVEEPAFPVKKVVENSKQLQPITAKVEPAQKIEPTKRVLIESDSEEDEKEPAKDQSEAFIANQIAQFRETFQKGQFGKLVDDVSNLINNSGVSIYYKLTCLDMRSSSYIEMGQHKKGIVDCKDALDLIKSRNFTSSEVNFNLIFLSRIGFAYEATERFYDALVNLKAANGVLSSSRLVSAIVRLTKLIISTNLGLLKEYKTILSGSINSAESDDQLLKLFDICSKSLAFCLQNNYCEFSSKTKEFELYFCLKRAMIATKFDPLSTDKKLNFKNQFSLDISLANKLLEEKITFDSLSKDAILSELQSYTLPSLPSRVNSITLAAPKSMADIEKALAHTVEVCADYMSNYLTPPFLLKISRGGLPVELLNRLLEILDKSKLLGNSNLAISYLQNISLTDRFSLTKSIMTAQDKRALASIFDQLSGTDSLTFEDLKKKYY